MLTVMLFTRKDDRDCVQAIADLDSLQGTVPHSLVVVDIESDPVLLKKYGYTVPVMEVGPYRKAAPFSRQDLLATLSAARDRKESLERISSSEYLEKMRRGQTLSGADKFSLWMSARYLLILNIVMFLYVALPFLAPALLKAGATAPARAIYTLYSPLCHQLGFRSFFLFGPQITYPRELSGAEGVIPFGEATGVDEFDLWAARVFTGSEQVGYKVALCERDVAIYGAILLFGILYAASGRRFPKLHWAIWLLLGIAPIGLDGFSQLFSQAIPGIASILPVRESTVFLRLITGALFGFTTAWFGYPHIEESMQETRAILLKKIAVLKKSA